MEERSKEVRLWAVHEQPRERKRYQDGSWSSSKKLERKKRGGRENTGYKDAVVFKFTAISLAAQTWTLPQTDAVDSTRPRSPHQDGNSYKNKVNKLK